MTHSQTLGRLLLKLLLRAVEADHPPCWPGEEKSYLFTATWVYVLLKTCGEVSDNDRNLLWLWLAQESLLPLLLLLPLPLHLLPHPRQLQGAGRGRQGRSHLHLTRRRRRRRRRSRRY